MPTFHGLRHTAASEAIRDGESAEEVSWQLGHKDSNVTRAVYIREIKSAERSAARRANYEARISGVLAKAVPPPKDARGADRAQVVELHLRRRVRR